MAKKKAKKKVATKAKKKTVRKKAKAGKKKAGKPRTVAKKKKRKQSNQGKKPTSPPTLSLREKMDAITERIVSEEDPTKKGHIDPTGTMQWGDGTRQEGMFRFTQAQKVFRIFKPLLEEYHLDFKPYVGPLAHSRLVLNSRGTTSLTAPFQIYDKQTGESMLTEGTASGANGYGGEWGGNTAQTRCKKYALLFAFELTWEDPLEINRAEIQERAKQQMQQQIEPIRELVQKMCKKVDEQIDFWKNQPTT